MLKLEIIVQTKLICYYPLRLDNINLKVRMCIKSNFKFSKRLMK